MRLKWRLDLRLGMTRALECLGRGFLEHPHNHALREGLESSRLSLSEYHNQLLRLVYRIIFLCVAEDRVVAGRPLLHPPDDSDAGQRARDRYAATHGLVHLRQRAAEKSSVESGADRWKRFQEVVNALAGAPQYEATRTTLALPALGGFLWAAASTAMLEDLELGDEEFLAAIRAIGFLHHEGELQRVDYGRLGTEELGGIYEGLLALTPVLDSAHGGFRYEASTVHQRKATGSYFTPDALVQHLLDSALDPIVQRAIEGREGPAAEDALLALKVCDPAVGSGHFLVGAAHRIARCLAAVRARASGHDGVSPIGYQRALRDVIGRCLYGVDVNPMSAELCRVSLWLEALEPGKPLTYLEHHIRAGNSLIGATPERIAQGIPDDAFASIEGADQAVALRHRNQNRRERRSGAVGLFEMPAAASDTLPEQMLREAREVEGLADDDLMDVEEKRRRHEVSLALPEVRRMMLLADTWCAAFFWPQREDAPPPVTDARFHLMRHEGFEPSAATREQIASLAAEHRFFHWALAFPEVHARGGFDCILGNPPFLNQLEKTTTSQASEAAFIRWCSGGRAKGYADLSATFLLRSIELVREGGRLAMIQPASVMAARDARGVRAAVLESSALCDVWLSQEHVFDDVNVFVCAVTLEKGGPRRGYLKRRRTLTFEALPDLWVDMEQISKAETWSPLMASSMGLPEVDVRNLPALGEVANATADFRDQYYGLEGFILEDSEVGAVPRREERFPRLVTTGLLDLAVCHWGRRRTRILKRAWEAPRIDRDRLESEGALAPWVASRRVPKVLLATQTRILEAFADERGELVPSIPLITITWRSQDPRPLAWLAAAVASPLASAVALCRYAGAALSESALKLSASQVLKLPLPIDEVEWALGAKAFTEAQDAPDDEGRKAALEVFARAMSRAYGLSDATASEVEAWWFKRLP